MARGKQGPRSPGRWKVQSGGHLGPRRSLQADLPAASRCPGGSPFPDFGVRGLLGIDPPEHQGRSAADPRPGQGGETRGPHLRPPRSRPGPGWRLQHGLSGSLQQTPIRAPGTRAGPARGEPEAGSPWPHPSLLLDCVPLPRCGHKGDARHPPGPARSGLWGPPLLLGCGPSSERSARCPVSGTGFGAGCPPPRTPLGAALYSMPALQPGRTAGGGKRAAARSGTKTRGAEARPSSRPARSAPCCQSAPRRAAPALAAQAGRVTQSTRR